MSIFFWKNNGEIDKFSIALADELFSAVPPPLAERAFGQTAVKDRLDKKSQKKADKQVQQATQILSASISKVRLFKQQRKLGTYGKARLHLKFLVRLQDLGYPEVIAKRINEKVLLNTP